FGGGWGFLFGALMNLYSWPFLAPGGIDAGLYWSPGASPVENLERYGRFYLVTSLGYDAMRAVANVGLIIVLGGTVYATLDKARGRGGWVEHDPSSSLARERGEAS
ncbi:MAG: ECF transporter S component, partial [Thermomicrobiales bacterium]